jgi:hypothetical protein
MLWVNTVDTARASRSRDKHRPWDESNVAEVATLSANSYRGGSWRWGYVFANSAELSIFDAVLLDNLPSGF